MEERLIEAVKCHICLFDKSATLFRNKFVKEKAWQDVSKAVGVPVEHYQQRWKSLWDRFVREIAGQKQKSGAAADDFERVWCYLEPLMFLKTHVPPRRTVNNLQWSLQEEEASCGSSTVEALESPSTSNSASTAPTTTTPGGKRRRKESEVDERFNRLCGAVEKFVDNKVQGHQPSPNAEFFVVLDRYLQKHSQERQDQMKIDILNYVHTG